MKHLELKLPLLNSRIELVAPSDYSWRSVQEICQKVFVLDRWQRRNEIIGEIRRGLVGPVKMATHEGNQIRHHKVSQNLIS